MNLNSLVELSTCLSPSNPTGLCVMIAFAWFHFPLRSFSSFVVGDIIIIVNRILVHHFAFRKSSVTC